jgi:hypothetical protein
MNDDEIETFEGTSNNKSLKIGKARSVSLYRKVA